MAGVQERIVDALRDVYDPCCAERGISVVDMGLIDDIRVDGDHARVELVLTSGWCPFALQLVDTVQARVRAMPDLDDADVEVVWNRAWDAGRMSPAARAALRFLPDPGEITDRDAYVAAHASTTMQEAADDR